jgi:hypothetical protein
VRYYQLDDWRAITRDWRVQDKLRRVREGLDDNMAAVQPNQGMPQQGMSQQGSSGNILPPGMTKEHVGQLFKVQYNGKLSRIAFTGD